MHQATCAQCGVNFMARRYDQRFCVKACRRRFFRDSANRICESDGCRRPVRAKGLCQTHYNKSQPNRHRRSRECQRCGVGYQTTRSNGRFCSLACRDDWRHAKAFPIVHVGPPGPVTHCVIPASHPCRSQASATKRIFSAGPCGWCEQWFVAASFNPDNLPRYCSTRCMKNNGKNRRGRFMVPDGVRLAIYRSDDWNCQLCGDPVGQGLPPSDLWAATLDHIVPRSKGGSDDPPNLRLAHRWCNSVRGDDTHYTAADLAA